MQKIIEIDNKQVLLESNAATPLVYHRQFKKDYFADLLKILKAMGVRAKNNTEETETFEPGTAGEDEEETKTIDLFDLSWEALDNLNFIPIYNIVWALAKSADSNLPEPFTWLEGFESFPLTEVMEDAVELIGHSINAKKKSTKPTLVGNH